MKTTGYQLCDLLRKTADETANHERALIMTWAADEIEHLVGECKLLEKEKARLADKITYLENGKLTALPDDHSKPPTT